VLQEEARQKIRALIVDDEPLALSNLRVLLARDPGVEIVGECASGMQALSEIRKKKPELVFLDVQMPEVDGFDVLE
jgi:two-component system LytT family response regulator